FSFQLAYSASESEQLSASGSYSTQTQTLSLDLRMMFQTEEAVEDGTKIHHFEANLQVELSQIQGHSIQPYVKKEDIVSFVRRLLEKISELVADDGQDLAGVVLDLEDFQDIVALDNGKLAELLSNLIQMVVTQAQMKRILDGGEEPVLLAPQREAISGVETYNYLRQVRRFRFTVKEVTEEKPPDTMDLEDILSANDSADVIKEDRPASTEA
ncbi:MAG: hypothetical protein KAU50_06425, partial [Candidatus Marinimicrobia bacterium]|nr:hypothetical protein [Candidatus Neomarinimicrobiota bacterium]